MPLPDEYLPADAAPTDTSSEAKEWAATFSALHEDWQHHLERWPESARTEADRSEPSEPGSWRGDGGRELTAQENRDATQSLEKLRSSEREISVTMRDVETSLPDASLVGFEYRLKEPERCKEKIADYRKATPDRSIEEITAHLPDAVRYTLQASIDKYADTYRQTCRSLRDRGNEMVRSVNSWDNNQYKGINTRWQTERGQPFEVQFHTSESFQAKQLSHDAYERIRNPDTSPQERRELRNLQSRISGAIHVPDGASEIPDLKKEVNH